MSEPIAVEVTLGTLDDGRLLPIMAEELEAVRRAFERHLVRFAGCIEKARAELQVVIRFDYAVNKDGVAGTTVSTEYKRKTPGRPTSCRSLQVDRSGDDLQLKLFADHQPTRVQLVYRGQTVDMDSVREMDRIGLVNTSTGEALEDEAVGG